ncbi:MAG: Fe-S protein assembly co-chaperone HscB [Gammaproteobacteria bacterium]|nr:Fe-S protein assembly co-chaperone HscB [Gammaproteobacteria bacterium]
MPLSSVYDIDLTSSYFKLFSLPISYQLKRSELDCRYQSLQRQVHPDRYAAAGESEQLFAMQAASQVNNAYQTLRNPLQRAIYMLELAGIDPVDHSVSMPPDFLGEQIELREQLAEAPHAAKPATELSKLKAHADACSKQLYDELNVQFENQDYQAAVITIQKLQFFQKLQHEADERLLRLETQT